VKLTNRNEDRLHFTYKVLQKIYLPAKAPLLPLYAYLLGIRIGSILRMGFLSRVPAFAYARIALQSVLPRWFRPRANKPHEAKKRAQLHGYKKLRRK
jgi:hypothetical protein